MSNWDSCGRLRFDPEYHPNRGRAWMVAEQQYLIDHYVSSGPEEVSLALGRTLSSVSERARLLRSTGQMPGAVRTKNKVRVVNRRLKP